ncbi:MAG: AarF/ABC1/UbiB kinase family protein [Pseudomonadales bacterium]|nr:AarF/ABC1/UbiB kinase family protein [Pseudomonadales bacterium]
METSKNSLPESKFSRTRVAGVTTAKVGIKKAVFLSKKPFISKTKLITAELENNEEIAALLFKCIGQMKGTALKLAQMLSMQLDFLPEEIRQELEKSASKAPGLNKALIRKTITAQLGSPPEALFKHFENTPFAAASLGQVHRAVTFDNEEVAVKVQYPGIATSIKSDIDLVKILLKPTQLSKMFSEVFKELERVLKEELDYEIEAENTNWFYNNSSGSKFIIPRVYAELSTSKVITTSMIAGEHLDVWLSKNPDQKTKNHYGQRLVDFYEESLCQNLRLQADPNIGNYLFRADGKLGLIDFGCTKTIKLDESNLMMQLYGAKETDDFSDPLFLEKLYGHSGIVFNRPFDDPEFNEALTLWVRWNNLLSSGKNLDYSTSETTTGHWKMGMELFKNIFPFIKTMGEEDVYFMRSIQGLHQILDRLDATVIFKLHQNF